MSLLNLDVFGVREHQRPNFDGFIYTHYAAPPYSAGNSAIYLLPFGEVSVPFADFHVRRLALKKNAEFFGRWVKTPA